MNPVELIIQKRNGRELQKEDIYYLIESYTNGSMPDYQMSAFLMASFIKGLSKDETAWLTSAMLESGKTLDLSMFPGPKIGKHSTGGIGDKTTLILTPIAMAAGIKVPQITGRGLGHTGGTLDKLDSIPGFDGRPSLEKYKKLIDYPGGFLAGQTDEVAPADRLMYSLRDVTGTVESIPLITASIMSKKIAEGTDGMVFDVKTGSGAFMKSYDDSKALAESLMYTAKAAGKKSLAMITEMSQPIGYFSGNWLEVYESILMLNGEYTEDIAEITLALAGAMLYLGGVADTVEAGYEQSMYILESGDAFDKFIEIIKVQGGDVDLIRFPEKYPVAPEIDFLYAPFDGFLKSVNGYELGMCLIDLGAGRYRKEDLIDYTAGLILTIKIGDPVKKGQKIGEIRTSKREVIDSVKTRIMQALEFSLYAQPKLKLVKEILY